MAASKTRRFILGLLLVSFCFLCVFGLRYFAGTQATPTPFQPSAQSTEASESTLVFAGLSGQSPRYIESGPDKGLGYLDQDSREIRKGLIQDGFQIAQEWMTPARIAHEFRIKSPICIYPTEWSRPKELFSKPQDRIYSIPLSLGGNENRFIWVKKSDAPRFKKHLDAKGSVRMNSLIEDVELKTLLIRDKDYGELGRILTEVDAEGDQVVREKFKKHVGVLLLNDSRQMVEMLNANRFDYILSDEIEDQNWKEAKVDESQFVRMNFSSSSVKGADDPNLVYHSVSCSLHPLSIRAMPYINKWIAYTRSFAWAEKSFLRRAQRQKSQFAGGSAWVGSVVRQFRGRFETGDLDRWYGLQQKKIQSLKLFPDELNPFDPAAHSPNDLGEESASSLKHPLWYSKSLPAKKLMIWNDSSGLEIPNPGEYVARIDVHHVFRGTPVLKLLSASELDLIETEKNSGTPSLSIPLAVGTREVQKLTLFAKGLTPLDFSVLLPILKNGSLRELSIIGASPEISKLVVENLPKDLRILNLISCALSQTKIHLNLPVQSLRELRLDNSQLQAEQLGAVLEALSNKIEVLSLGHSRTLWTLKLAQAFGSFAWPKLRELNLEQSYLNDEEFLAIQRRLPVALEVLSLRHNCVSMKSLGILFRLPFTHLQELDLSGSDLNHLQQAGDGRLRFPPQIKRLYLAGMSLTPKQTRSLMLPNQLETLDLEDNPLSDEGLVPLLFQLSSSIEKLNLSKTGLGTKALQLLAQKKWGALVSLELNWNLVGDDALEILKAAGLNPLRLGLGKTGLTKRGLQILGETWARDLLSLDLSGNSFRSGDLGLFYSKLNPKLRELNLSSNSELDIGSLAQALPQTLKKLDLSYAQLSNSEMKLLAPRLPKSLRVLNLSKSGFDWEGVRALAQFLPQNLEDLNLEAVPLGKEFGSLVSALPRSLRILRIGGNIGSTYSSAQVQKMARALPQGLEDLWLVRFQAQRGLSALLGSLPPGLTRLRVYNVGLDQEALSSLNRFWPATLRELYLEGTRSVKSELELGFVPHTIERLAFLVAGFDLKALEELPENRLQNLHLLQVGETSLTVQGLREFLGKARQIRGISLSDPVGIFAQDFLQFKKSDVSSLSFFGIANAPIGNHSLKHLLSVLPPQVRWLDLSSVGLTFQGVEAIAPLLPRGLRDLYVPGNAIGQKGLELLKKERARREARGDALFQMIE